MINKTVMWEKFRQYESHITNAELNLIEMSFDMYCEGNSISFESSAHKENMFYQFKTAWIMSSIWNKGISI